MNLTTFTTLLTASTLTLSAADWPQWGGGNVRNMYSPQRGLPDAFGKIEFKPGTDEISTNAIKNLKWIAKLGSQSYGNVTVSGGKVFIGTNNEPPRDPKHEGDRSILLCFDEKTAPFCGNSSCPSSLRAR
ncbi:MAG: hypothetical protein QM813_04765 [Verrucomicrobiota bacterium]